MSSGVADLLINRERHDQGYEFTFDDDLNQMSIQMGFLQHSGFDVGRCGVYSAVKTQDEFDRAITAIWNFKIEGWWHYKEKLVELKVCINDEFQKALYFKSNFIKNIL
jgi:hypothetical protein